jgi:CheY-like chemotaxis protein
MLIISDLNMPCMTGLELLAWTKEQPDLRQIPFFLMSSSNSPADRCKARDLGAEDHLFKSSMSRQLLETVQAVVHDHSLQDAMSR